MVDSVRLDKWLLAARLFKTRPIAQDACDGGHVHVNDRAAVPARPMRIGDRVVATTPGGTRIVEVIALGEKRSTAEYARSLYIDHTPPAPPKPEPLAERERGAGRPTKRDRRLTDQIRGWDPPTE
jgi:ribosome-associated heat shock protein Hsp15